ncbi:MAG: HAMP domain-containing protein, partial [Butyricicoccus sp.]
MRNLFVKTYAAFAVLILVSFTFAGSVFLAQIGRSSVEQKKTQLETTVNNIKILLESNQGLYKQEGSEKLITLYLEQMASGSNSQLLLTDENGVILIQADDGENEDSEVPQYSSLSENLVRELNENNVFFGLGTLNGLFSENYYIAGARCLDPNGQPFAMIIATSPATETYSLMKGVMHSYLVIIFITLILTLIISWFLSDILTRPLKGMVSAVKQFTRGDFDVRVAEDNHCDEVDELAVSFNQMISTLQQQEELSRSFVANVSHELKT